MITHTYILLRRDGFELDSAASIALTVENETTREQAWELMIKGITAWVSHTAVGRMAWRESSYDLNVGDLLLEETESGSAFAEYLLRQGIGCFGIESLNALDCLREYDEVLVNREELETEDEPA